MPEDECPDFDQTLRNMLATPPMPRVRLEEPANDDEQVEVYEEDDKDSGSA